MREMLEESGENNPRWVERHSVNCYFCGTMFDERDGVPADQWNNDDGGTACPECVGRFEAKESKHAPDMAKKVLTEEDHGLIADFIKNGKTEGTIADGYRNICWKLQVTVYWEDA